jgi:RHS repeat-associated protein
MIRLRLAPTPASRLVALLLGALTLGVLPAPAKAQTSITEYYHLDALGSVRAVTSQSGAVVERHDYLPYGEEWCATGVCESTTAGQPLRFTAKERDAETGLDYFGARYYGSRIGRFTTTDPVYTWQENLVDPQRWNRYAYARNNPLRYVDPDGKAVLAASAMPSAETFQRNAEIRSAVMSVMRFDPLPQDQALVGIVLGSLLPASPGEFKLNQLSFMLGMAAPLEVGPQVLANRLAGKAAEAKVAGELVAEGKTILGSQVCCTTSGGRRFIDHLTKDAAGDITAVEVKSGGATRSVAQRAKDAEIAAGRGTFVGKNARSAGVEGTQRAVGTVERRPSE